MAFLNLQKGKGVKFFYILTDAHIGPAKEGGSLTKKDVKPQHVMHVQPAPQEQLLKVLKHRIYSKSIG
jgi:hypothetical protein